MLVARMRRSLMKGRDRLLVASELLEERTANEVSVWVTRDALVEQREPLAGVARTGDREGAVHAHGRRRLYPLEERVELGDFLPVRGGRLVCATVGRGDRRFELQRTRHSGAERGFEECRSFGDRVGIPQRSILLRQGY